MRNFLLQYKKYLIILSVFIFLILTFNFIFTGEKKEYLLEVKNGDTYYKIADTLAREKIIRSRLLFKVLARFSGQSRSLHVGFYKINGKYSMVRILSMLAKGKTASRTVTVPEGYNVYQIADLLAGTKAVSRDKFLSAVKNQRILKEYNIHQNTAEGFLFPETYFIPYHFQAEDIVKLMLNTFQKNIKDKYSKKINAKFKTFEEAIILASLVEWEAQVDFERPIIAAVFLNRLARNLKLDSCATVLYALQKHKNRLLFKDLKVKSPYNTYIYQGLPPTPICNPSEKSILAVIYPAKVDYLYFVSMKNKRHYFSRTYSEHLKAYRQYIQAGETE